MLQVIPGILEKDWSEIERKLNLVQTFTNVVHVDLIDGKFVNNQTFFDPEPFKKYSGELFLELHMMVFDPANYIESWGEAGFRRFLGHIEHMGSQGEFVKQAKKYGEVGLALDGPTNILAIKVPLEQLNCLLIYTSNRVGFSGPLLMEDRLDKVRHLRKLTNIPIEVDGGINNRTIERAKNAGASRFVATSHIWQSNSPSGQYSRLSTIVR